VKTLTLDTGALIAFDRGGTSMTALVRTALARGGRLVVPSCVIAQAWRDGSRQTRLSRLLKSEVIAFEDLNTARAKAVGELCGRRETSDITDAFVAIIAARHGGFVATSDPDDLLHLNPALVTIAIN
jgi:hypothetical protein